MAQVRRQHTAPPAKKKRFRKRILRNPATGEFTTIRIGKKFEISLPVPEAAFLKISDNRIAHCIDLEIAVLSVHEEAKTKRLAPL